MKRLLIVSSTLLLLVAPLLRVSTLTALAQEDALKSIENSIKDLREKLDYNLKQQNTLSNKISFYNNQIQLTSLQIEQTSLQIASLSARIDNLENRLDHISEVFHQRTVESYKLSSKLDPVGIFLSSDSFSTFIERLQYLRSIQANDHRLMVQLEETRSNYDDQKTLAQLLNKRQEVQKATLDQQRKESTYLLEKYRGDAKGYQQQLDSALAEQAAMEAAQSQAINLLKDGTHVEKGTAIAQVGNTGYPVCSTGTHLHFEVRKDNNPQDPANFLKNTQVAWDNQPDPQFSFNGSWDWPIENPKIEQGFGRTYWAKLGWYRGGIHTGIDLVSDTSSIIRAPISGTLYKGASTCGGLALRFVAIDAGGGQILWFWHVQ
jgi:peptidoglycan hydrolase CwlO-like protein